MTEAQGRGAWNSKGVGGTLKLSKGKIVPGQYYMWSQNDWTQVGIKAYLFQMAGREPEINDLAVNHGVLAIQVLLNYRGIPTPMNGVFTKETDTAVKAFQGSQNLTKDGIVGKVTMQKLLLPLIKDTAAKRSVDWKIVFGLLEGEGNFDPGAVGYYDINDLGLSQINTLAHPDITFSEAFCASKAVNFTTTILEHRLDYFKELDLAIASYNLGIGGTNEWIKLGRPDPWTPKHADKPRSTVNYINKVLHSADILE